MIRVRLPHHLRTLAQVDHEVSLPVEGEPTLGAVLDAIESAFPVLRGTMRDATSGKRRPFVRFFACEQDLSHSAADAPLPEGVIAGRDPFLVVGAMAGG